jgi:chaperone LolA
MRKIGTGLGIVLLIGVIAWLAGTQLSRPLPPSQPVRPVVAHSNVDSVLPTTELPEAQQHVPAQPVVQPVARPEAPQAEPKPPDRPLVSDKIPSIVNDSTDTAAQQGATILKRASAAYASLKSMRADFVQRRENPLLGSSLTSRGRLYQRTPDRFLLQFTEPAGDVIVSDGRYFWLYYPSVDSKQVLRSPASDEGAGAVDLQAQFIGDPLRRFTHKYEGKQNVGGRPAHVLTLTPRHAADAGYRTLKVWIDDGDYLVRRFQITEQTGTLVEFHLSSLAVNPTLGDEIFRFTPPRGARVVER